MLILWLTFVNVEILKKYSSSLVLQNQFFHFEVQANKAGGTGGSVSVKVDPLDAGDLQLHKLQQFQEIAMQQQQTTLQASAVAADQNQSQFQVTVVISMIFVDIN